MSDHRLSRRAIVGSGAALLAGSAVTPMALIGGASAFEPTGSEKMTRWTQDRNIFLTRHKIDPARRDEFVAIFRELLEFAAPFYDRGCKFAFQGFSRDPNEWIVIASWDEVVARELRAQPRFQELNSKMMDCCVAPMRFEYFAGLLTDRSIFDAFPVGESKVHAKGDQYTTIIV